MFLHSTPRRTEVPEFSPEQLETLTRSVEEKKQKLEDDIKAYIQAKQEELGKYERQLIEQYCSKRGPESNPEHDEKVLYHAQPFTSDLSTSSPSQPEDSPTNPKKLGPEEAAKRTKHTRVHKREKELCGLVTPIFLPLLDASDASPTKKKKPKSRNKEGKGEGPDNAPSISEQGSLSPSRDGERGKENRKSRSRSGENKMDSIGSVAGDSNQGQNPEKKSKRSSIKKSSLRHNSTTKTRRKRVSLVIDDQIVHPSDNITDPSALRSPSETTISTASTASTSTSSLESTLDPQLTPLHDTPVQHEAVHHSVPLPMTLPSTSPTKHTGHTLSASPPPLEYEPPQTTTRTFLDPSPPNEELEIPPHASAAPIYADESEKAEKREENFSTYVGGIDGSGVDDVDQVGSYGYPNSLGASYLESYMKSRPLSVRIAAAEKAGLKESEKRALIAGTADEEDGLNLGVGRVEDVDEGMEVIGSMEGF
ncbi:hypothetical protein K469DRAFT_269462 [Zopfia rhizophila CBS 207.26]|uniref:Uncharacterized protein n=1 Tax=Zopfia rhizophila CBS 207.26 TaxID=1314779 RepID=A0A6A6DML2_9PEZI|nr:hypothetical protein K469DRAFT_269462 [Zopfia rhizophila CBS 207.26]